MPGPAPQPDTHPGRSGQLHPHRRTGPPALFVYRLGSSYQWSHVTGPLTVSTATRSPARRRAGTRLPEEGEPEPRLAADPGDAAGPDRNAGSRSSWSPARTAVMPFRFTSGRVQQPHL